MEDVGITHLTTVPWLFYRDSVDYKNLLLPPPLAEIGDFFARARRALPRTRVMLGCARPLGELKQPIDRLAVDAGLNGIAYPADGIVEYARARGLEPSFINACCGVSW